jgi:hypothetical protein
MKNYFTLVLTLVLFNTGIGQNYSFEASFQAFTEDSAAYACHYKDFYFIAHDCGLEVRYGNAILEKYEFTGQEEWLSTKGANSAIDGFYYCNDLTDVLFMFDPSARWAYIRTVRGQMQLYYETPETFMFKTK